MIVFSHFEDLTEIMANSRSYKKLLYAWEGWHNESGVPLKKHYPRFVELSNKASQADGKNNDANVWPILLRLQENTRNIRKKETLTFFFYFRICRHWSRLEVLVWDWYLRGWFGKTLPDNWAPLPEPACICAPPTLQTIWTQVHKPERTYPCPPARYIVMLLNYTTS